MRIRIFSERASRGALNLARAMGIKKIKINGSRFYARSSDKIINWGNTTMPDRLMNAIWINHPSNLVFNKLHSFQMLGGRHRTVPYTVSKSVAESWAREGNKVYIRKNLSASQGIGIEVISNPEELISAPLYTKQIKGEEYRIHIVFGTVIDIRKKARLSTENLNSRQILANNDIKSHANGWIFKIENSNISLGNKEEAINILRSAGYDFGALDVIIDEYDKMYLLEINSAPGLVGTTLENYKQKFLETICR